MIKIEYINTLISPSTYFNMMLKKMSYFLFTVWILLSKKGKKSNSNLYEINVIHSTELRLAGL